VTGGKETSTRYGIEVWHRVRVVCFAQESSQSAFGIHKISKAFACAIVSARAHTHTHHTQPLSLSLSLSLSHTHTHTHTHLSSQCTGGEGDERAAEHDRTAHSAEQETQEPPSRHQRYHQRRARCPIVQCVRVRALVRDHAPPPSHLTLCMTHSPQHHGYNSQSARQGACRQRVRP